MATQASIVVRHLRGLTAVRAAADPDGQLLERFAARREGKAFEELVRRHGPMVLGVCRRVLGGWHDAEDAFQATFLILAKKAATITGPGSVVGEHSVIFSGPYERIELTHRAEDRMIFARGAIKAACWARGRKPGHYSMADVLGIGC